MRLRLALSVLLLVLTGCVMPDNSAWEYVPEGTAQRAFIAGAIRMCQAEAEHTWPPGLPPNEEVLKLYCLIRAGQLAQDADMLPPPIRRTLQRMPTLRL